MTMAAAATVACGACDRKYGWKAEIAGKKAKCKCGEVIQMPFEQPDAPGGGVAVAPRRVSPIEALGTTAPVAKFTACRKCTAMLTAGAVVCMKCGTNQQTGKSLVTAVQGPGADVSGVARGAGHLMLAMVVGGVTSLVCAGIFLGIAIATGKSWGIVSMVVGILNGVAMRKVNGSGSQTVGYAAAGFALLALAIVKLVFIASLAKHNLPASMAFSLFDILWVYIAVKWGYRFGSKP